MPIQEIEIVAKAVNVIEQQLSSNANGYSQHKLDLPTLAQHVKYSKFYLHRMFAGIAGLTIHAYVLRRQLTEAARLLIFSGLPLIEIAMRCGYTSQQAFTMAFKAMYKLPPAKYRERQEFYPLQLPLKFQPIAMPFPQAPFYVRPAMLDDIPDWLDLARQSVSGYPHWHESEYCRHLHHTIDQKQALLILAGNKLAGALAFSASSGCIDFLAVQPQYRRRGLAKMLLQKLRQDILPQRKLFTTTFRANDCVATGQREVLKRLGFAESEQLIEFGYPTQQFVLPASQREVTYHA